MEAVAREIDPDKTVDELLDDSKSVHPTAEGLLDAVRQEMASIRQYVIDHEIATIPEGETLRVIETPAYLRPIIPYGAYMAAWHPRRETGWHLYRHPCRCRRAA